MEVARPQLLLSRTCEPLLRQALWLLQHLRECQHGTACLALFVDVSQAAVADAIFFESPLYIAKFWFADLLDHK